MTLPLRPARGGFLRPFGCGMFIKDFLFGKGPYGSARINRSVGAPQADIFYYYKNALRRAIGEDRAVRREERLARKEQRPIDPERIAELTELLLSRLPYKSTGCRYHSLITYFSDLKKLGWVEPSGVERPSAFQDVYPDAEPRRYYRLTEAGKQATDQAWGNPHAALYGKYHK